MLGPLAIGEALRRKYDVMEGENAARMLTAKAGMLDAQSMGKLREAQAFQTTTAGNLMPGESEAQNFLRRAQGNRFNVESSLMPGESVAEIGRTNAQAGLLTQQALTEPSRRGLLDSQAMMTRASTRQMDPNARNPLLRSMTERSPQRTGPRRVGETYTVRPFGMQF